MNYTPPKDFDIVKQWGPWTLTRDGRLHSADLSRHLNEDWYLDLTDLEDEEKCLDAYYFIGHNLAMMSNLEDSVWALRNALCVIFDGRLGRANPSKYVKDFIRKNSRTKRVKLQPSLRFKILHRDQYRCQACGATAANGAELHVDHILPVSKGGTNNESNLRVLCSECNIGRGNRYDT